jgi:hypothetical protein
MITGYGGKEIPPFSRTYIGGEQDIRGFQIWGISPIAFIPSEATINVLNNDGSQRNQLINGVATNVTMNIPVYQLAFPGGDTHVVGNFEYRIPIFGPVILAIFADAGIDRILRPGQLNMDPSRIDYLNNEYPTAGLSREGHRVSGYAETAHVHRPGVASAPACGAGAFPRLLGVQPAAGAGVFAAAHRGGPLGLSQRGDVRQRHSVLWQRLPVPGAARYVPLHHRPHVLKARPRRACCNMLVSKQIQGVSA